jgi:hypothetical protein
VRWSCAWGGGGGSNCSRTQGHREGLDGGGRRRWMWDLDNRVATEAVVRQTRRWGGNQRLQSESEVGREPSFATIGGGTTNSVVARQWDILGPGGGSDLKSGGVVTSLGGCGAMTLRAMVRSPWRRGLGKKIFYHDLRSTNLALQQRRTRSEVATGRA